VAQRGAGAINRVGLVSAPGDDARSCAGAGRHLAAPIERTRLYYYQESTASEPGQRIGTDPARIVEERVGGGDVCCSEMGRPRKK